jgi:hypothetical protein
MGRFFISLILLLGTFESVFSQYNSNFWCYGDSIGIDWTIALNPTFFTSNSKVRGSSTSIGDTSGLLFYSADVDVLPQNTNVWNKHHKKILNGDFIRGGSWYNDLLFIPHPDNDSLIFLISAVVSNVTPTGFYYSVINKFGNSDSGAVVQKNIQLLPFKAFDGLTAIKHGNGKDYWLICRGWLPTTNNFHVFLIDSSGINGPFLQSIGSFNSTDLGSLNFNSNGTKLSMVDIKGLIQVCDFDRCTGLFSNCIEIEGEGIIFNQSTKYYSSAFSNNGQFLYVLQNEYGTINKPDRLYQFNLLDTNILLSRDTLYEFFDPESPLTIRNAPDGKIYVSSSDVSYGLLYPDTFYSNINTHLSVINYPDSLGTACDFQPYSFYLGGGRTYWGLPNITNYQLGPLVGSPCDTLTVGLTENEKNDVFFQAWYNSEWNMIHVNASKLKGKSGVLRLFDVEGRVVYERKVEVVSGGYFTGEIAMNGIAAGVYIVSLTTEKDKVQGKVLKF